MLIASHNICQLTRYEHYKIARGKLVLPRVIVDLARRYQHELCRFWWEEAIERLATSICSVVIEMDDDQLSSFQTLAPECWKSRLHLVIWVGDSCSACWSVHFVCSCFLNGDLPFWTLPRQYHCALQINRRQSCNEDEAHCATVSSFPKT